jgi:apolipoprotein D and lipocalin family protein
MFSAITGTLEGMQSRPPVSLFRLGPIVACVGIAVSTQAVAADPLPTVRHVDLGRYAGTWHEIARLPNMFQRSCASARADYTPCGDGTIRVVNTCFRADGRCSTVEGWAEPVPGTGNARLRVKFGGLAALVPASRQGNYWIIALDDDYQWAMVGTPDRRFLWILARNPCLPRETFDDLKRRACCLGFAVENLVLDCR